MFAWGLDFGDGAMLIGEGLQARFRSAETASRRFGARGNTHLVWVDPKPERNPMTTSPASPNTTPYTLAAN